MCSGHQKCLATLLPSSTIASLLRSGANPEHSKGAAQAPSGCRRSMGSCWQPGTAGLQCQLVSSIFAPSPLASKRSVTRKSSVGTMEQMIRSIPDAVKTVCLATSPAVRAYSTNLAREPAIRQPAVTQHCCTSGATLLPELCFTVCSKRWLAGKLCVVFSYHPRAAALRPERSAVTDWQGPVQGVVFGVEARRCICCHHLQPAALQPSTLAVPS